MPLIEQNDSQFLKDIVLIFVGGFILVILLMATVNGYTARALTQLQTSPAMPFLEDAYDTSPDFIQDGINAGEDTIAWIHQYLDQHHPTSKLTVTAKSVRDFLKEVSDGKPVSVKELDQALYDPPESS